MTISTQRARRPWWAAFSITVALFAGGLAGCGGTSDDGPTPLSAVGTVGAAGGTVDGPSGARVVVPVGALSQPTAIDITQSSTGAPALPVTTTTFGQTFALTPHGTTFATPVTVRIPFDPTSVPAGYTPELYKTNAAQTAWETVPGATLSGGFMDAQVTSFSFFVVSLPARLPIIAVQPSDQSVTAPGAAAFQVSAFGLVSSGLLGFQWKRDGVAIAGATGSSYTTGPTSVAGDDGHLYSVDVKNLAGTVPSRDAKLTVLPVAAPSGRIAAGDAFSFAVNASGVAYSWGSDGIAGLGNGPPSASVLVPTALTTLSGVKAMYGSSHGVAVLVNGNVMAWGYRGYVDCAFGQTADSPFNIPGAASIDTASSGEEHTLLLDRFGKVFSFGCTGDPQLGRSGVGDRALEVVFSGLPAGATIKAVAAGTNFSLALDSGGNVWSWGRGTLGYGNAQTVQATPRLIPNLSGVIAIAAGDRHALALVGGATKTIVGWGANTYGELGDSTQSERLVPTATVAMPSVKAIAAGASNSLAIRESDGVVLSWGINNNGQLGGGPSAPTIRLVPGAVLNLSGVEEVSIGRGVSHALAVLADGSVWGWGYNTTGQLGDGTATSRSTPVAASGFKVR